VDATADPMIRLEAIGKRYADGTVAVHELSLEVARGQVAVLIGPSGCGKTTTMRMINRLEEPTSGRIVIGGDDIHRVDAVDLRRQIGYVIQNVGLFPHQTVAANVATVPRLKRWDRARTRRRTAELLDLVGLDPARYAQRYPHELSGGQRQRVGVARALAADPPVLLMDEPFGAVDPIARDRLQGEFLRLQQQVRKTIVFVTHDMDEAVRLGDRIAVMRDGGHLEQYDEPAALFDRPATPFVADFVGGERTLRRLAVGHIDPSMLVRWPTVAVTAGASDVTATLDEADSAWVVVVDDDRVVGWLDGADASGGHGGRAATAGDLARPATAVDLGAPLEVAFAALIAAESPAAIVTSNGRYVGVLTPTGAVASARRKADGAREPGQDSRK
jgi:osmoprotectant transport system ATP-binding protein